MVQPPSPHPLAAIYQNARDTAVAAADAHYARFDDDARHPEETFTRVYREALGPHALETRAYEQMEWYNYLFRTRGELGACIDDLFCVYSDMDIHNRDETFAQSVVRKAAQQAEGDKTLALCIDILQLATITEVVRVCNLDQLDTECARLVERIHVIRAASAAVYAASLAASLAAPHRGLARQAELVRLCGAAATMSAAEMRTHLRRLAETEEEEE